MSETPNHDTMKDKKAAQQNEPHHERTHEMQFTTASRDTDAVLRERDAEKWEEGRRAWAKYELACEDAAAAGQGHLVLAPVNPYRTEGSNDQ